MSISSLIGRRRYERLWLGTGKEPTGIEVGSSEILCQKVMSILQEYMQQKDNTCVYFGILFDERIPIANTYILNGIKAYKYEELTKDFSKITSKEQLKGVALEFQEREILDETKITRFIIVCNCR